MGQHAGQFHAHQLGAGRFDAAAAVKAADQPRGHLRVDGVNRQHLVGHKAVAAAVGGVEGGQVAAKGANQRAHLVRVGQRKSRVLHQRGDGAQHVLAAAPGLQGEPFVHHQRFVGKALGKVGKQGIAGVAVAVGQRRQRAHAVGHIVGLLVLLAGQRASVAAGQQRQIGQRQVFQRAPAGVFVAEGQAAVAAPGGVPALGQRLRQLGARLFAHLAQAGGVGVVLQLQQLNVSRQGQRQRGKGRVAVGVVQQLGKGVDQAGRQRGLAFAPVQAQQLAGGQGLAGFPAVEGVAVVGAQKSQFFIAVGVVQPHRGREVAQQRGQRFFAQADKGKGLLGFGHRQHAGERAGGVVTGQGNRQLAAVGSQQAHRQRDVKRQLVGLPWGVRAVLAHGQRGGAAFGKPIQADIQHRRAGLAVPALELGEVDMVGVGHGGDKILAGHRLAVVAAEVQIHALTEARRAHQGVDHAHHFGAFFVHRQGVEIIHLDVGLGAHRVGGGAGVLRKLQGAQAARVFDALDRAALHVCREFLVAEHRQPFFQAELEPIPAGDAVAGPVVEVFMGNHRLDAFKVEVGGGFAVGQHKLGVEDVQAFVFHGAHIEVANGDNHIRVQVVFQAKHLLVPLHGFFQRAHRVGGFVHVCRGDVNLQRHLAPAARGVVVAQHRQFAGHHGKQIGRLAVWVHPFHPMAPAVFRQPFAHFIAIGQQHRKALAISNQRGGKLGHHVRAVEVIGDFAKAFWLALGVQIAIGGVQAHQRGVGGRLQPGFDVQNKALGHAGQGQHFIGQRPRRRRQRFAIQPHRHQLGAAIQLQRVAGVGLGVAFDHHARTHAGVAVQNVEFQIDAINQERGRTVVFQVFGDGRRSGHGEKNPGNKRGECSGKPQTGHLADNVPTGVS